VVEGRQLYYVLEFLESPMVSDYLSYCVRGFFSIMYGNKFIKVGVHVPIMNETVIKGAS
jgi:hypothetical protein